MNRCTKSGAEKMAGVRARPAAARLARPALLAASWAVAYWAAAAPPAAAQCAGGEDCPLPLELPFWMSGFIAVVWLAGLWALLAVGRWWLRVRGERRRARRDRSRPGTAIRLE